MKRLLNFILWLFLWLFLWPLLAPWWLWKQGWIGKIVVGLLSLVLVVMIVGIIAASPDSTTNQMPDQVVSEAESIAQTPTDAPTHAPTPTDLQTPLPTDTATETHTPIDTPLPTNTPTETATPLPTATLTDTPLPTATFTNTPLPTDTPLPTNTPTATPTPTLAWYAGGTLHQATLAEWRAADDRNRRATAADWVTSGLDLNSLRDIEHYSNELLACVNESFEAYSDLHADDASITDLAVMCLILIKPSE